MPDRPIIVQKLGITETSILQKARKYYAVLLALNGMHLSPMELDLLAFTAVKGTISTGGAKEQFCQQFKTSKASIANLVYKLTKRGLLITINKRTKVVDPIQLDFNKDLLLNIKILHDEG